MPSATMTSKGQITIPKEIRESLELEPGDRVAFRMEEDSRAILEPETFDLSRFYGCLKPKAGGVTTEAMKRVIRERGAGR